MYIQSSDSNILLRIFKVPCSGMCDLYLLLFLVCPVWILDSLHLLAKQSTKQHFIQFILTLHNIYILHVHNKLNINTSYNDLLHLGISIYDWLNWKHTSQLQYSVART